MGYIRVSRVAGREGDSFQSPDEQRRQIEAWAKLRGVEIDGCEEDIDVSGGILKRPGLETILGKIKAKSCEGVVVSKLDRLSRLGVADALKLVEQIHADGGSIVAVDLGIDPTTPFGEFGMTIMLALARMERRRLADSWISARTNAVNRGAFVGPTPLGYARGPAGKLIPDPTDGPLVKEAFEISGSAGLEVAHDFCRMTWPDRFWNATAVRKLLASRVYRGDVVSGEIVAREVIEPLVTEDVWYLAQHSAGTTPTASASYPLSGIAHCAACGGRLTGHMSRKKRSYCCASRTCTERPHLLAEPLEDIVATAIQGTAHRWMTVDPAELDRLKSARTTAQTELENYVTNTKLTGMDQQLWIKGFNTRQDDFAAAQIAYNSALDASGDVPDLDDPSPEDLHRMIKKLTVRKGSGPLAKRVKLKLAAS